MKRTAIIVLLLVQAFSSFAQGRMTAAELRLEKERLFREDYPDNQEIRIGIAGAPASMSFGNLYYDDMPPPYYSEYPTLNDVYGYQKGTTYAVGIFLAEYCYHFNRWFSLAASLDMCGLYNDILDPYDAGRVGRENGVAAALFTHARFYWSNRRYARLYSAVGIGFEANTYGNDKGVTGGLQLTPIGITIGRKVFFFAEYSYGTMYVGGTAGVGYRF